MARTDPFPLPAARAGEPSGPDALDLLAVAIAVVMPVLSALIYPTYVHYVTPRWLEWTRLHELPFVAFEMVVCALAARRGLDLRAEIARLPNDVRLASIALVAGVWISSLTISRDLPSSIAMSIATMIHLLFALSVLHLLRSAGARRVEAVLPVLAFGVGVLALFTAWRVAAAPPAHSLPGGAIEWFAAIPGFISIRHFGAWTGAIGAGFVVAILFGSKHGRLGWAQAGYLLCATATVWSATRAAMLAMLVATAIVAVALRRVPSRGAILRAGGLTALAFAIAAPLTLGGTQFQLYAAGEYATIESASAGRSALWAHTFWRWLESPLLGWGSGSTFWEVHVGWTHTQPHNAVLQFLISWGLVGAAGALYLLGRAVHRVHRPAMADARLRPLLAVLYALLFQSLLEGMLHYPRFIEAIFFLFALIVCTTERRGGSAAGLTQPG
ncbi:MAG: O-antigen ligase family protein [Cypionkella sp.]